MQWPVPTDCMRKATLKYYGVMQRFLNIKRVLVPLLTRPRVAQFVKWAVYTFLFVNFAFYLNDDLLAMKASLDTDADWVAMAETFVTSIDTVAWLLLIVLLEFETYVLSEEAYTRWVEHLMLSMRIFES